MSFGWPIALWGLLLVALALVAYLLVQRRRKKYVVRFTNLALLENVVAESPRWRRHVPPALTLLALAALDRRRRAARGRRGRAAAGGDRDPHHGPVGLDDRDRRAARPA